MSEPTDADYRAKALTMMPSRDDVAAAAIEPPAEWLDEDWSDLAAIEQASREPGERVPYDEFRRDLGLSEVESDTLSTPARDASGQG